MTSSSKIVAGQELGGTSFHLDPSMVQEYLSAVEDSSPLYREASLAPPTAIAALGIRAILGKLSLPPGTLHTAQELAMHRAVASGEEVTCAARVVQSSQRGDWTFAVVEFTIVDQGGEAVLDGRTTLMIQQKGT